jgi:hypothetical protein
LFDRHSYESYLNNLTCRQEKEPTKGIVVLMKVFQVIVNREDKIREGGLSFPLLVVAVISFISRKDDEDSIYLLRGHASSATEAILSSKSMFIALRSAFRASAPPAVVL